MADFTREKMTFSFNGQAVEAHEIEVSLLAESLVAFRAIAERASKIQYGKNADLLVKVKGGFQAGSFNIDLILDWVIKNPEGAAALGVVAGAGINKIITGFVSLYKWARGKDVVVDQKNGESVTLVNEEGQVNIFNNSIFNMYVNKSSRSEAEKLTRPLDVLGMEGITLSAMGDDDGLSDIVTISREERRFFLHGERGNIRDDEDVFTLEIVYPSLDGKGANWKLFDGDAEYNVTIEDDAFLERVKKREILLGSGDMIEVRMRVVQKRPNKKLITERTVLEVLAFIPAEQA